MTSRQYADPAVSRAKFDREVAEFRSLQDLHRQRGWLLVKAEFPIAHVLLATSKTNPCSLVTGVAFDYTNYDAAPPSVRLIHPLTAVPFTAAELPTRLDRSVPGGSFSPPGALPGAPQFVFEAQQPLMQWHGPEEIPFVCLAGVREYHDHPAHTGDSWEMYRRDGHGRLVRLLEIISRYGVEPILGFKVQFQPLVSFNFGQAPA
jgi:hypothetical protein